MARVRMVTRTVYEYDIEVMEFNLKDNAIDSKVYVFTGNKPTEKEVEKFVNKGDAKFLRIVNIKEVEQLYGMTELDFIAHAEKLPPRFQTEDSDK